MNRSESRVRSAIVRRSTLVLMGLLVLGGCAESGPETPPALATEAAAPSPTESSTSPGAIDIDPALVSYERASGVSGNLNSIGSDTLNNVMTLWAEGFNRLYPNVRVQIEGKGSSTAPPALIEGTAQVGPMSRAMKESEIDQFEKRFGYKPTQVRVAVDALAVYVNKDNPLEQLRMDQVDAIFSSTRKCGLPGEINTWGEASVTGAWSNRPISLYGRNSASGTYGYFKKVALCGGDYRDRVKEQPGSASVVQGVTEDLYGIGYSGIGYKTSGVKTVALSIKSGEPFYGTDAETVLRGDYPLSRYLYLYVNKAPNQPLDPLVGEFLQYVLSAQGQTTVVKDGYLPLSSELAGQESAKLGE